MYKIGKSIEMSDTTLNHIKHFPPELPRTDIY